MFFIIKNNSKKNKGIVLYFKNNYVKIQKKINKLRNLYENSNFALNKDVRVFIEITNSLSGIIYFF